MQVEMRPKKDDVAGLGVISLGHDLDTRRSAHAHGLLSQNLPVRYAWSEEEIDRQFFRDRIGTRPILLHPPLLRH